MKTNLNPADANHAGSFAQSSEFAATLRAPPRMARRSFLRSLGIGAALLAPGAAFIGSARDIFAQTADIPAVMTQGDIDILRFLTAAELIEADLWQQYTELAVGNPPYQAALDNLDEDMPQYIIDNTDDERSHAMFLNSFLMAAGDPGVNLDAFRTLPGSHATGIHPRDTNRLTNLMNLTVDTSWWLRYRAPGNPDFDDEFKQFIEIVNFPAIPNEDLPMGSDQVQAIANTAAFHFATIEQGGSSLYGSLIPKASDLTVLKILVGIGGVEVNHFAIWHDKAGNAPAVKVPGVEFPDMKKFEGDETRQKNLIMPEPCKFIDENLPLCSVIRPTSTEKAGAVAAINGLTASGLFQGQSNAFFTQINAMAMAADAASRQCV